VSITVDTKKRLYEIAESENTTVSEIARRFIEKGINEYKEDKNNG
jgi:predicted DNA-binding protein